jgi:hypothetical protein
MKKIAIIFFTIALFLRCDSENTKLSNYLSKDKSIIDKAINEWDKAWETKDVDLAIKHSSERFDKNTCQYDHIKGGTGLDRRAAV